jgi:N-acetyl-gamma-glutamyl-phosphate reductase
MLHNYYSQKEKVKVAVVGGSGYTGVEVVRLLEKHPFASLRVCFSSKANFNFKDYLPNLSARSIPVVDLSELDNWAHELNTVFLATPAETSLELAPRLIAKGIHVIDFSGAFRLKEGSPEEQEKTYERYYKLKHTHLDLLEKAEYGLVPWNKQPRVFPPEAHLVANPGCYATSVLMAILPLLKRGLIQGDSIVIDAKSGTSGAGRKASQELLFTEVEGECLPYRIGKHQHLPEIQQFTRAFAGSSIDPLFATHLLPVRRGILSSIYAKVNSDVSVADISRAYCEDYSDYGLVQWGELTGGPDRSDAYSLSLRRVVGTGHTRIHYHIEGDRLYLFSLIDNLIKGAAGQAIENFNEIHRVPHAVGLDNLEAVL